MISTSFLTRWDVSEVYVTYFTSEQKDGARCLNKQGGYETKVFSVLFVFLLKRNILSSCEKTAKIVNTLVIF